MPIDEDAITIIPAAPGWQIGRWATDDDGQFDFWTESIIAWRIVGGGENSPRPIVVEGQPIGTVLLVDPHGRVMDRYGGRWGDLAAAKHYARQQWQKGEDRGVNSYAFEAADAAAELEAIVRDPPSAT